MGKTFCLEFVRFSVVGVGATLVHFTIAFSMIHFFKQSMLGANLTAYAVALMVSFLFNSLWSFKKEITSQLFFRFFTANISVLLVITVVSQACAYYEVNPVEGTLLIAICSPLVSFTAHKIWTFSQ